MARIIPNQNTYIAFATTIANIQAPTAAEIAAGVNLTPHVMTLNASASGNTVPTPSFDSLFETNIPGTQQASFSGDFYRNNASGASGDLAWVTLPRLTSGFFVISRFGGTGANQLPIATNKVEVWPVLVTSRTMANMSNNTVMTFTVTCSVPEQPAESAVVAA